MSASSPAGPLGVLAASSLSQEQLDMLDAIEREDLWFVQERLEAKHGLSKAQAADAIDGLRRYMALIGLGYRGLGMVGPTVDQAWHEFILFTREYAAFCRKAFGEFIHHVPRTSRDTGVPDGGARFAAAYEEVFGERPAVWRVASTAVEPGNDPSGCGTEDCRGE
jgi:hypothetical protein